MSSQPVGFSKPEDRSASNSTSWQLEAGKDVERNEKSRYATSNYSSFIDPDEDNQSVANKWFIRKLCIYDRFFQVQTLERSWHLYLAWHTHTPPPLSEHQQKDQHMIGTKEGTQWGKLSLSSLHLEVRLQRCCEQVFYITNISNVSVTPHWKNTTEQEAVHVYSCENSNTL